MNKHFLTGVLAMFLLAGCSSTAKVETSETSNDTSEAKAEYSLSDIEAHATKTDCWMAIEGKVYDVTKAIGQHPGGEAILLGCGKDATEIFEKKPGTGKPHSEKAEEGLDNFYIGNLKQ